MEETIPKNDLGKNGFLEIGFSFGFLSYHRQVPESIFRISLLSFDADKPRHHVTWCGLYLRPGALIILE